MKLKIENLKEKVKEKSLNIDFSTKWVDTLNMQRCFGIPSPLGYSKVISELGNLEEQLKTLKNNKRIISLSVGCCDSGTRNSINCFNRVIQYLVDEKIQGNTYLLCNPSCSSTRSDYEEIVNKFKDYNIRNNLIFDNYLSNTAGWDCADARNISKRLFEYDFNDNEDCENLKIRIYKVDKTKSDLEVLESLFKKN